MKIYCLCEYFKKHDALMIEVIMNEIVLFKSNSCLLQFWTYT